MSMQALENKFRKNESFARGFLEGLFGLPGSQYAACSSSLRHALHWLDGWVEGSSLRVGGGSQLPNWLFNEDENAA
ncbi:MAG: hypothetical protein ACJAWP_000473 [Porticoccus sp.]|jgi:hypothetical protein|uniref:hypothetical protein n=1 Tax=Porticoccus sp. TaxID=2024853 RepID=UPI0039E512CC